MGLEDKIGKELKKIENKLGLDPSAERPADQSVATGFDNLSVSTITSGTHNATVSGKLLRKDTSSGIEGANVLVTRKAPPKTTSYKTGPTGDFGGDFDTSGLTEGPYDYEFEYAGDPPNNLESVSAQAGGTVAAPDATEKPVVTPPAKPPDARGGKTEEPVAPKFDSLSAPAINHGTMDEVPSTDPCNPCTDLISAAKRVLRDPKVNQGIGEWLLETAKSEESESKNRKNLARAKEAALTSFAKAVAGKDAVAAKGQPCRGQLRLFFEFLDLLSAEQTLAQAIEAVQKRMENTSATSGRQLDRKKEQLNPEILKTIQFQLLDDQLRIAGEGRRTYDEQGGILISGVEAGTVYVSLLEDIFGGAEIIDDFLATDPGRDTYNHYKSGPASVGQTAPTVVADPLTLPFLAGTAYVNKEYKETLTATGGKPHYTYTVSGLPDFLNHTTNGESLVISGKPVDDDLQKGPTFSFTVDVTDSSSPTQSTSATYSITCQLFDNKSPQTESVNASTASAAIAPAKVTPLSPRPAIGYSFRVGSGQVTSAVLFLRPPAAHVRCFSFMEGDDCCGQGKQYISRVAISAMQGDDFIACKPTGTSGCSGFVLNPGWYTFSAPQEISIADCNYMLASSSPVSAFLGAGQGCSDIYFSYKKKGNEIQVISEIISALGGDPYVPAKENFPGMEYLLLSESDPTFVPQQQTTTDGGALCFRNLAAGTYLLFCQAPATFGSQPVTPVYPADGRLTLRVFGGQTSSVPVLVKFRTCTTAPAVLDGYVRDDTGSPIPQQLVQIVNHAGCIVAAGLADATGYYSIQLYSAENVTIVVGAQQATVSKAEIQAAMQTVGTPPLLSPGTTLDRAVQRSELVSGFGD